MPRPWSNMCLCPIGSMVWYLRVHDQPLGERDTGFRNLTLAGSWDWLYFTARKLCVSLQNLNIYKALNLTLLSFVNVILFLVNRQDNSISLVKACWNELFTLGLAQCSQVMNVATILTAFVNHLHTSLQQGKICHGYKGLSNILCDWLLLRFYSQSAFICTCLCYLCLSESFFLLNLDCKPLGHAFF